MGSLSIWHWLIVLVVVLLFFGGRGKIPELMGDFAKGIKSFKKGMTDDDEAAPVQTPPHTVEHKADETK
jgi:sec-independent protein translocase protein TatA